MQNEEQISNSDETTIYEFCQDGNEERVEQMLKRNFDVNKPDETVKRQISNFSNNKSIFSYLAINVITLGSRPRQ